VNANKTYSVIEIWQIREACRVYEAEIFALDLLCEGLSVDEAKARLATLDEQIRSSAKVNAR
jgi:hypothetical protein